MFDNNKGTFEEILKNFNIENMHSSTNQATLIGNANGTPAILLVSPPTFDKESIETLLKNPQNISIEHNNDIFSRICVSSLSHFSLRMIYPADASQLKKYSEKLHIFKEETYEQYLELIQNEKNLFKVKNAWIDNIIDNMDRCELKYLVNMNDPCNINLKRVYESQAIHKGPDSLCTPLNKNPNTFLLEKSFDSCKEACFESNNKSVQLSKCDQKFSNPVQTTCDLSQDKLEKYNILTPSNSSATDISTSVLGPDVSIKDKKINEKIFYNDYNFFITPNFHWDMKKIDQLYLVLMFKDRSLYTIRDIESPNILLKAKEKIEYTVKNAFDLNPNQIYMFFHYHPTFYSLHLHICHANYFGHSANAGRAIMLEDVIRNLKIDPLYYKKATLRFRSPE